MIEVTPSTPTIRGDVTRQEASPLPREQEFMLKGVAQEMFTSLEPAEVTHIAVKIICPALNGIGCSIWTIAPHEKQLFCLGATGIQSQVILGQRFSIESALAETDQIIIIPRIVTYALDTEVVLESSRLNIPLPIALALSGAESLSVHCIPLQVGETSIGILQLLLKSPQPLTNAEYAILGILADSAALAIRNAQMYQEASRGTQADLIKLRERIEAQQEFIGIVSHDLRAPLTTILGFSQMLIDGLQESQAPQNLQYLAAGVLASTARISNTLTDLLVYALSERKIPFGEVDCEKVLKEVVADLQAMIVQRNTQLTFGHLPTILGDRTLIRLLFQNLIANGIKFNEQDIPSVHIGVTNQGDFWLFSVSDNGIGIDPKDQERIFKEFERGEVDSEYEGTGLGLSTCKRIVERQGGRIWVDSKVDKGSTFFFTIPKSS